MMRRPYRTKLRPFIDDDTEVTIRWYFVPEANGTLQKDSRIESLDWTTDPWTWTGVGEVYGAPRLYDTRQPPLILPTNHVCGTDRDFAEGEILNPTLPPTVYANDGIPTCCRPPLQGLLIGGGAVEVTGAPAGGPSYDLGTLLSLGTVYAFSEPASGSLKWWYYPVTPGDTYVTDLGSFTGPGTIYIYTGDGVALPTLQQTITGSGNYPTTVPLTDDHLYIAVLPDPMNGLTFVEVTN